MILRQPSFFYNAFFISYGVTIFITIAHHLHIFLSFYYCAYVSYLHHFLGGPCDILFTRKILSCSEQKQRWIRIMTDGSHRILQNERVISKRCREIHKKWDIIYRLLSRPRGRESSCTLIFLSFLCLLISIYTSAFLFSASEYTLTSITLVCFGHVGYIVLFLFWLSQGLRYCFGILDWVWEG